MRPGLTLISMPPLLLKTFLGYKLIYYLSDIAKWRWIDDLVFWTCPACLRPAAAGQAGETKGSRYFKGNFYMALCTKIKNLIGFGFF